MDGRIIEAASPAAAGKASSFRISIYSISKRTSRRGGLSLLLLVLDDFCRPQWIEARKGLDGLREGTQENELSEEALQIL